ncbi:GNAT family N-acetyltransferase [Clostridium sp. D2Q-11]|uniref:GNAT family N-acetyltransferase n=1 Tax=Anaeromonas frigoriresistens TaxID=2683708 RepID=A0A942V2Q6_9FIRM|nr:GNAT family N-acetyltransferase [Anaeromonas frigoriresistens]MBS4538892.1 GNAT family N-acetyltransferase [Anaeromonas frigoriresistens]
MRDLFLAKPDIKYQRSFEDYVLAYKKAGDEYYFNKYKKGRQNFNEYLNELINYSKGIDLPQGEVMTSSFWLIHRDEVIGVVRVRHQEVEYAGHIGYDISPSYRNKGYGSEILKLALKEAKKIGIVEAIVTCNIDNMISKKIIEKNNGKLLGRVFDEEENENLYKYSIFI